MSIEFVELVASTREALKQADTLGQWAALMPEAEVHSYRTADGVELPFYLFPGALWDAHLHASMPHGSMMGSAHWQPEVYRSNIETLSRFLRRHGWTPSTTWAE